MAAAPSTVEQALDETILEMGLNPLKPKQTEAVLALVSGKDTFVSLPTGYGKSIIYGVLPFLFDKLKGCKGSIVVCISPLTAIMMDQQAKFTPKGVAAEFVGEAQEDPSVVKNVLKGNVQLLFISPESILRNKRYRSMLLSDVYKQHLVALVVDEAHCIKMWGDKFRTAFAEIGQLRCIIPETVPVMALTATATSQTFKAVVERLTLRDVVLVASSPQRSNITYNVRQLVPINQFAEELERELNGLRASFLKTIVFCRSYHDCSSLYRYLHKILGKNFTDPPEYPNLHHFRLVDMYTRATLPVMKEKILTSFKTPHSKLRLVIATTAFSMGIDCPDIRRVFHYGPPSCPEYYAQETGRAGRDGLPSQAILLYGKPGKFLVNDMKNYGENTSTCRQQILFQDFLCYSHTLINPLCKCCDICASKCGCDEC